MPFKSEARELVQWGAETTPGTSVAATKRLSAAKIRLREQSEMQTFVPSGSLAPGVAAENDAWATGTLEGIPTYTELLALLAMYFETPVTTTPAGGTTSRDHTFTFSATAANAVKTFTIEEGPASGTTGHKATYCFLNEFNMTMSRRQMSLGGSLMGKGFLTGQTPTALTDAAAYALIPMLGKQGDIYLADTFAGLAGASKYDGAFQVDMAGPARQATVNTINSSVSGFTDVLEQPLELGFAFTTNTIDATFSDLYTKMKAGTVKYLRIQYTGAIIEAAIPYKFEIKVPVFVRGAPDLPNRDGVKVAAWDLVWAKDADPLTIVLTNTLTSLA